MDNDLLVGAAAGKVIGTTQASNTLEPKLWKNQELDDKVQHALAQIAFNFVNSWDLEVEVPILDIILTGSTAGYNWTEDSDIDLHIVIDLGALHTNKEAMGKYLNAKAALWNAKHNITIFGHPVELYVQDVNEPHVASGVYSIAKQDWIERPTSISGAEVDTNQIYSIVNKYADCVNYLQILYDRSEFEKVQRKATEVRTYLKNRRAEALHGEGGINSTYNLVFKILRKSGLLNKLAKLQEEAYDSLMTVQEQEKAKLPSLEEVISLLSHPEKGFTKGTPEQKARIVEILTKILSGTDTDLTQRKTIVKHLQGNPILKTGMKSIIYDLLEEGALEEYAQIITEGKLMPFSFLGEEGNLISKFQEYYAEYPNLCKENFLRTLVGLTSANGTINIGKGEIALALLCENIQPSKSAEGDLLADGCTIELKASDARAISQKSGYRENADKVILEGLKKHYGITVPALTGRFAQKLLYAFNDHTGKLIDKADKDVDALAFISVLNELLTSVYRGIKIPQLLVESAPNPEYIKETESNYTLDSDNLERDLAKVLLEDYISHHSFDKWFCFNAKTLDFKLINRLDILKEASTDPKSPVYLYVRDGTVRMTYGKLNERLSGQKIGYHSSFKSDPSQLTASETIQDAALAAKHQSKTGFLGTGLYYFGDAKAAEEHSDFMKTRTDRNQVNTYSLDTSKLKMYTPQNAEEFVNDLRVTTINLYHLTGEELKEEIMEAASELMKYTNLSEKQLQVLLAKFAKHIKDPNTAADKTQLSNRLLSKYDGIDLTGTSKDHFGTGSVIFPKAIQKSIQPL